MRALLDVNVLVALLDSQHVFHLLAHDWLNANLAQGWASCPITQNGCIRILSQPSYPNSANAAAVAASLRVALEGSAHTFWPDDVNLPQAQNINWQHIFGSRQVTDAYLLALAVKQKGRFVSFDQNLPIAAVAGANVQHVVVLGRRA